MVAIIARRLGALLVRPTSATPAAIQGESNSNTAGPRPQAAVVERNVIDAMQIPRGLFHVDREFLAQAARATGSVWN
jgi:hypothetical protein